MCLKWRPVIGREPGIEASHWSRASSGNFQRGYPYDPESVPMLQFWVDSLRWRVFYHDGRKPLKRQCHNLIPLPPYMAEDHSNANVVLLTWMICEQSNFCHIGRQEYQVVAENHSNANATTWYLCLPIWQRSTPKPMPQLDTLASPYGRRPLKCTNLTKVRPL